ncbi:uncharacterized protein EI90DRAFT_3146606 [Cantharellus anzutake]|uniref:uncharacterized protein n=1 Tax=Cantharellus anzutake TaxID=1750568 RepID=UPI00190852D7|nr:uncharacterized protein EI90DRAFT_3146606 [Cantharellus anzutake]KAF8325768.1 hypothetical protein EI90DRAFT_3146606 [Cantharellus anzutake]
MDIEHGVRINFSKSIYQKVAPSVGLHPFGELNDIGTFEIHRCRIPTNLFKSIVMDMDNMLIEYGAPFDHETDTARSRFISPIFNHLVSQFTFMLRNHPKNMLATVGAKDHIGNFYKIFGAVAIISVEMMHARRNSEERLKGIAQIMVESNGCDLENYARGFSLPIHCIFHNGPSFEFFKFESTPNPTFLRGCFQGDPKPYRQGVWLEDLGTLETPLPFVLQLRCVCETIFDVMLSAYIAGLKAGYNHSKNEGKTEGSSFDEWDRALRSAERAQATFRKAEVQRQEGNIVSADATVDEALLALQERYAFHSSYRSSDYIQVRTRHASLG